MKYYVYISDTKIEMFYSQLANSEGRESQASLGVDLKVLKAEVKKSHKSPNTKYTKLEAILKELENSDLIGEVDGNKPYVRGDLEMTWASFGEVNSPITFWGYLSDNIALGLAGSRHHVLGAQPQDIASSRSDTDAIARWFIEQFDDVPPEDRSEAEWLFRPYHSSLDDNEVTGCILAAVFDIRGPKNRFEFVAKVLHRGKFIESEPSYENNVVLATPLYVAMK
jgi:hypothetical protein